MVFIGIALFFALTALAEHVIYVWDKNVSELLYCEHGVFVKKSETAMTMYGYCVCDEGWWGKQCEFEAE